MFVSPVRGPAAVARSHVLVHRRVLFIDAMGTLVSLADPVPGLVASVAECCGVDLTPERARRGLAAEIAHYRAHMQRGRDAVSLAALHRDCAAVLRDALAIETDLDTMTAVLLGALRFAPFPDARAALVRAHDAGARVIVVSNWDVSLADVLTRVGLAELVDAVVTSAGAGARKPDPAIFARALTLAGVPASDCVHVGDSPAEDVAGARAAGVAAVLVHRGDGPAPRVPAGVSVIAGLDGLTAPLISRR
jgi:putative hydrolase of the HAD superfamily